MRAARKCGPTRGLHSTRSSSVLLRCLLRNLLQNPLKQQIPLVSPVVPEGVFVQVGLQIFCANAVVDAADSPLHETPESLNRLSVDGPGDIDSRSMVDAPMSVSVSLQPIVADVFIGIDGAGGQDIFLRKTVQSFASGVGSHTSNDAANATRPIPLDHSHHRNFVAALRRTTLTALTTPFAAVVHLIHLHRRTLQLLPLLGEQGANLTEHAPRGFVGDASLPLNLLCGDAATSGTHEVHGVEPSLERSGAFLEHGPRKWIDVIPAMVAGVSGAASDAMVLALYTALHAPGNAIWPALFFDVLKARIVIRELAVKVRHGVTKLFRNALLGFHDRLNYA